MTATEGVEAEGLSSATGESVGVVLESLGGALSSTLGVVFVPLALAAGVLVALVLVVVGRKVLGQLREARRQDDPRERFDPDAPDVLGVW